MQYLFLGYKHVTNIRLSLLKKDVNKSCFFIDIIIQFRTITTQHKLFGEQLRQERKKQGLTAHVIAQTCGISRSYITLIENGRRRPGKKILPKIAVALNLKTTVVLNWYLEDISQKMHKSLEIS